MKLKKTLTLKKAAELISAEFEGEPGLQVSGFNEIHMVTEGDLTFVDHPKYYSKAIGSDATVILINRKINCPDNKGLIFSEDPFRDFNILTGIFYKFVKSDIPVSRSAHIGKNTIVQPGVFIGNNVEIGDDCIIHANVSICDNCIIGDRVIINANTVIGSDAFYYKKRQTGYDRLLSCGRVIIKDNVDIGANCTIDRGVSGDTIIGEGTKIDNLVQVAHDVVIGRNCLFAAQVGIAGVVTIEDDVALWGQVGVQKDLTIGKGAVVLGQSGIGKSLEGNKVYFGSPASEAKEKMRELVYLKRLPDLFEKSDK